MIKQVMIKQVDNGYIVVTNQYAGIKTRVFNTWLELFTEMGGYFSEIGYRGNAGTCNDAPQADCESVGLRRRLD